MARAAWKNNSGMTLIEVLVALAIVFIIFLGLSDAGLVVLNENIKNSMRDEAVGVAESAMQNARNLPFDNVVNDNTVVQRRIRGLTVDYTVTRSVTNPDGTTPLSDPNNRRVTIDVTWDRLRKTYSHSVVTIVRLR